MKNQGIENYGETSANSIAPDKEQLDEMINAKERYHELTREAEALERAVSEISDATDRAFGADKIKLMKTQGEALEKLKEKQEALLKAQELDLVNDFGDLSSKFENTKHAGTGEIITIQTDADGNISNYSELVAAAEKQYNDAIKRYNESA
jgi:seryl-tRNA synthetase